MTTFATSVLVYFLTFAFCHMVLVALAWTDVLSYRSRQVDSGLRLAVRSPLAPAISVIVPAFNESAGIVDSVHSLLALEYPRVEIVVVNDGSTDATLERLIIAFDLRRAEQPQPPFLDHARVRATYVPRGRLRLLVIDKENAGKADSLNTGINYCRHDLVCVIDADSILEKDALMKAAMPFIDDPRTVASGGVVGIANGCRIERGQISEAAVPRRWLPMFQMVEYLRTFSAARGGWSRLNALLIVSGAFGLFDRDALIDAGGYRTDIVGEDIEMVVRLHRRLRAKKQPYRVVYVADPICWTEAPETLRDLRKQRRRWQRGSVEAMVIHRGMLGRPRYGAAGMASLPALLLFELLGPVIELFGYVVVTVGAILGMVSLTQFALFLLVAVLYGLLLSLGAAAIDETAGSRLRSWREVVRIMCFVLMENAGYRQLTLVWRIEGYWQYLRKGDWGVMERRGLAR